MTMKRNSSTLLLSLIAGAGAGLVVGVMLAPKSGRKLRAQFGSAVDDYVDSARDVAGDVGASARCYAKKSVAQFRSRFNRNVDDAIDAGKGRVHDVIDNAAEAVHSKVDAGAAKGHDAVDRAADSVRAGVVG